MRAAIALLCARPPDPMQVEALARICSTLCSFQTNNRISAVETILACAEGGVASGRVTLVRPLLARSRGTIALLHAALVAARTEPLIALDATAPLPEQALLLGLAAHPARGTILLLEREPLCAFPGRFRRGCLRALRAAIARGQDLLPATLAIHATRVREEAL